jgi:23S rRNA (guanosine2251-2'-O)-methyltransferase
LRLDSLDAHHQGVALEVSGYPYADLADMLHLAEQRQEPPFLLILDTLQDPQNLGTLLRTAEAVGVHGVLLPLRHTVTVTPAVVHASSGASEHLLIAQANLAQSIEAFKAAGVWVIGLESSPQTAEAGGMRLDGSLALVVGSEAEGMRQLVKESCDGLLRLPMRGQVDSLNASVAGSIALYLAWQARQFTGARNGGEANNPG